MTLFPPDGLAQISVNVIVPEAGTTLDQYFSAFHDAVLQGITQDTTNGWQSTQDKTETIHGMAYRFRTFKATQGPSTNMELQMIFVKASSRVLALNVVVDPVQGKDKYGKVADACVRSLKDPAIKIVTPVEAPQSNPAAVPSTPSQPTQPALTLDDMLALEKEIQTLLKQVPDNAEVLEQLAVARAGIAMAYWQDKKIDEAVAYMRSSVRIDPNDPGRLELFADMLDDVAEPAAPYLAQSYYEDALKLAPTQTSCRAKLAASYLATGELDQALDHFKVLANNQGQTPDGRYFKELSLCFISTNQEEAGIQFFKQLAQRGSAHYATACAILLNQTGKKREAVTLLRQGFSSTEDQDLKQYMQKLIADFS